VTGVARPRLDGPCHVWWAPARWGAARIDLLTSDEHAHRRRLRHEADRERFTTGRVLTRLVLAERLRIDPAGVPVQRSCATCGGPHGKARLPEGSGWEFSVTHSGDLVGLAVTPGAPVGVDVERMVPLSARDLEVGLTGDERRQLADVAEDRRPEAALRLWVRKEALVKATGSGVTADLRSFMVGPPLGVPAVSGDVDGTDAAAFTLLDLRARQGYVASLAVLAPSADVVEEHVRLAPAG
jgi:4'-phosphopantetheinyl transferase